ncbi:MAG: alpha/beta fold hydrolase [Acidobacteria bacterium]|nr:MAG: alpha/beta fold hydrolase [Acidobacteriota bacterium]
MTGLRPHRRARRRTSLSCFARVLLPLSFAAACAAQPLEFPELAADVPVGEGRVQPCLEELPGEIVCGRFRVWEDRAARRGRTLDLAFVRARATSTAGRQPDAVTFLFGGPGSSVLEQAAGVVQGFAGLRERRDLLLVDLRGVGFSAPLDCDVPYPGGVASRFGTLFPADHLAACRAELAQRADLSLYTSNHTMDDLDQLRAWLGIPQLNFWAGSYGVREVQVFARRHPEAIRSAVLDGASPITEVSYVTHARGLQDALDRIEALCASQSGCARDYPDLSARIDRLFARLRESPIELEIGGAAVRFGAGDLGYALRGLLYRRGGEVPWMVSRAEAGEWRPLVDYYLQRQGWVGEPGGATGMHLSVLCAEDIAPVTDAEVAEQTAGTFLGPHLIDTYRRACDAWPHAELPADFWQPVRSPVPALILSGEHDPVTPPSRGAALAALMPNSLHVVVPGAGHGVGGPCIARLTGELIERADVSGLDPSCVEAPSEHTEFRLLE